MKKAFRLTLSITMLAALGVAELQAPANCQMSYGAFLAKGCVMPCCKTNLPMPKCPMMRKAPAPRDTIASSVPSLETMLQPLHVGSLLPDPALRPVMHLVARLIETIQFIVTGPPPAVRAPPADAHLLNA